MNNCNAGVNTDMNRITEKQNLTLPTKSSLTALFFLDLRTAFDPSSCLYVEVSTNDDNNDRSS